jgi:hypothetical protein
MNKKWLSQNSLVNYACLYPFPSYFRLCQNFSDNVGIFFCPFSHFHWGSFPTMSEFFPMATLSARKNPLLVDGKDPSLSQAKKSLCVAVKIFLSLQRESSVVCKAISRHSAEKFSFFYSVNFYICTNILAKP